MQMDKESRVFAGAEGHTKESQGMEKQPKRANATLVAGEPVAARSKGREGDRNFELRWSGGGRRAMDALRPVQRP